MYVVFSENSNTTQNEAPKEMVDFKVVYNKQKLDVEFPLDETVAKLKTHIQTLTGTVMECVMD